MNKTGSNNLVFPIIAITIAVLLVATLLIPAVKITTDAQSNSQNYLVNTTNGDNQTTLRYSNIAGFTSVTNGSSTLTENVNFTEANGVVTFTNAVYGDYTIDYTYYARDYDLSAGEIAVFALIALAAIVGLVYGVLSIFGLV